MRHMASADRCAFIVYSQFLQLDIGFHMHLLEACIVGLRGFLSPGMPS
jgi:hypothetical protein